MSERSDAFNEPVPSGLADLAGPSVDVLTDVVAFLRRFIAYPSEHAAVAHGLWIAHTHLMDCWESTPRLAFLSPEPGSGKSRALEVTEPLVPRAVHAVNTTPAYLFRKVADDAGKPTILYDEIDTVFGPKAKDNEDTRGMLNAGHRKGAKAGRCVVRGKTVETEELDAYCAVALAGLDDLPDTIMSRSIVVRMRRRAPSERIEPWRRRVNGWEADDLCARIEEWTEQIRPKVDGAWPQMPEGVEDRDADVWEALLAIADAAGDHWPVTARSAAVALVNDATGKAPSLGIVLLRDLRMIFEQRDATSSADLIEQLTALEESPWGDLRGKPLDVRGLSRRLAKYNVRPVQVWVDGKNVRGYKREDLADAWARYLEPLEPHAGAARSASAGEFSPGNPAEPLGPLGPLADASDQGKRSSAHPSDGPHLADDTARTSGLADLAVAPGDAGEPDGCAVCGQPLLLTGPGRTVCARTDAEHTKARAGRTHEERA